MVLETIRLFFSRIPADLHIQAVKAALSSVMNWRNAFAHGKVLHELNGGFLLQYHSGGHQELVLDDVFFEKVEATVRHCLYTCNDVVQRAGVELGDVCT